MKTLAQQMTIYHRYHTKFITKLTHLIGVPLIILALMMPLSWLTFGIHTETAWNLMWLSIVLLSGYYVLLSWRLGLMMIIIFLIMGAIAQTIATPQPNWHATFVAVFLFIFGWILQLIGHVFEKRKPALFDNLFQIFIAPIFLLVEVLFILGYCRDLRREVLKKST